jgi:preprotein translocase subunit SecG
MAQSTLSIALQIIHILISIALVVVILLQAKGSSGTSFLTGEGGMSGVTKTRRGLEKTLFNITVGLSIAFFAIAIINVLIQR